MGSWGEASPLPPPVDRTLPASYDYHCSLLDGCLDDSDSVTYEVNFHSPLNDLKHFHVANSQLPQDVMHVLLEGVVKDELKYLVASNYFSGDLLNERIVCFYYTPEINFVQLIYRSPLVSQVIE